MAYWQRGLHDRYGKSQPKGGSQGKAAKSVFGWQVSILVAGITWI